MSRRGLLFVAACAAAMAVAAQAAGERHQPLSPAARSTSAQPPAGSAGRVEPGQAGALLKRYCITCHNAKLQTAGLTLDTIDVTNVGAGAEVWEKVLRKLRARAMPPVGRPRPDEASYEGVASWLETELNRAAVANPNPGRTATFHRLNRTEYENAVRDLLAVEIDAASLLPADDAAFGFDNIGEALSVSPDLLDAYLSAANKVSRLAVGDPAVTLGSASYTVSRFLLQSDRMSEDLPFGSRGGIALRHYFPYDGEYVVNIRFGGTSNPPQPVQVRVDGALAAELMTGGRQFEDPPDKGAVEARIPVKAGPRVVGVFFVKGTLPSESRFPQFYPWGNSAVFPTTTGGVRYLSVDTVDIAGPFNPQGPGETPSRRRIFACRPAVTDSERSEPRGVQGFPRVSDEESCARSILAGLARRAYRRPVSDTDVLPLLSAYREGRAERTFEAGIQMALERLLADPELLFRVERPPADVAPGTPYRVSDVELASRLSFFLWSSIPDDELLQAAERGELRTPAVLEQQIRRMLADPRSTTLVGNWASQWLYLRNVGMTTPDTFEFPDWDDNLRAAMSRETELFLESQLREDRGVTELLTADYTYLNERLARHYGIAGVYGSHFRRVRIADERRAGLLGHASILMVTSFPNRTSPVVRGKWLLENFLNYQPPPPPPDVNTDLEPNERGHQPRSIRERMEQHRKNPVCAGCHAIMDPLGFSLENYDAIGAWRTVADGAPVDASGNLPDGTAFHGPAGLRRILQERREDFVMTVTEKLLTYALGRGIEYYDLPVVRQIVRDAAPADYRWSAIIIGIARSVPFQMRIK